VALEEHLVAALQDELVAVADLALMQVVDDLFHSPHYGLKVPVERHLTECNKAIHLGFLPEEG